MSSPALIWFFILITWYQVINFFQLLGYQVINFSDKNIRAKTVAKDKIEEATIASASDKEVRQRQTWLRDWSHLRQGWEEQEANVWVLAPKEASEREGC